MYLITAQGKVEATSPLPRVVLGASGGEGSSPRPRMAAALARRARVDSLQLTQAGFDCAFEEGGGGAPAAAAPAALSLVVRNFRGPAGTAYEGATFAVAVHLPASYPLASPSVCFRTRV